MREFEERFGAGARTDLETTFRCSDGLCKLATRFVLGNPAQIEKRVRTVHGCQRRIVPGVRMVANFCSRARPRRTVMPSRWKTSGLSGLRRARRRARASAMGCEIGRIRPTNVFERAGESRMTPLASSISSQVRPRISFLRRSQSTARSRIATP